MSAAERDRDERPRDDDELPTLDETPTLHEGAPLDEGATIDAPPDSEDRRRAATWGNVSAAGDGASASDGAARYDIGPEIARGGMGAILRVRDQHLRRSLAMKVMLGGSRVDTRDPRQRDRLDRFLEEAQVTAQLAHPGVVPVHELGIDAEGHPYFTMSLIRGDTLGAIIEMARTETGGWTRVRALQTILRVCETIAFAHDSGVIHRDLKPDNVMVGAFGETYVMDWGLAKVIGRSEPPTGSPARPAAEAATPVESRRSVSDEGLPALMTMEGTAVGTPAYMSPEQAEGRVADLDQRADVYAIGTLLYELLAGHPPYLEGGTRIAPYALLARVRAEPPLPLAECAPDTPDELVAICEKAMARAPEDRYGTASELAEDLQAFLENRVVRAYRTGTLVELRKWIVRNRATASAMAFAVVALVAGLAVSVVLAAEARRREEETARKAYAASLAAATAEIATHNLHAARQRLRDLPLRLRGWEWRHLTSRLDTSAHRLSATQLTMTRDGRLLVADDDGVHELDPESGRARVIRAGPENRPALRNSPAFADGAGGLLIRGPSAEGVHVVDAWSGDEVCVLRGAAHTGRDYPEHLVSPRDGALLAWSADDQVHVLDRKTGETMSWTAPAMSPSSFSADGALLALAWLHGPRVDVVEAGSGRSVYSLAVQPYLTATCFSPDGSRLAVGDEFAVRLFDGRTGEPVDWARASGHTDVVGCVTFSADGALLASGSRDRTVRVLDARTGATVHVLAGHADEITQLTFTPDGRWLVSRDNAHEVRIWDVGARRDPAVLAGHASYVYPVAISSDGQRIASGGWDGYVGALGSLRIWDAATGEPVARLGGADRIVEALAIAPDGSRILTCGRGLDDGWMISSLQIFDAQTGARLAAPEGRFEQATFSPDGALFAASADAVVSLFDAATGKRIDTLPHAYTVHRMEFRPDGQRLAAVARDGSVRVWRTADRALVLERPGADDPEDYTGHSLAYSPDGTQLYLTSSQSDAVSVLDAESGALVAALRGHGDAVFDVLPGAPGGRTFSACKDGRILVWDAGRFEHLTSLSGHRSYVYALAISPDRQTLVSSSGDGTLRVWETTARRVRQQAIFRRRQLVTELTPRVQEAFDDLGDAAVVVARLRAASDLDERSREVALQIALHVAVERSRDRQGPPPEDD